MTDEEIIDPGAIPGGTVAHYLNGVLIADDQVKPQPIHAGQTDRMELTPKEPIQPKTPIEKPAAETGDGSEEPNKEAAPPIEEKPVEPDSSNPIVPFMKMSAAPEKRNEAVLERAREILKLMEVDLIEHMASDPESTRYAFKIDDAAYDCIGVIVNSLAYAGWKVIYDGDYTLTVLLPAVTPVVPAMQPRRVSVNSPL